MSKGHHSNPPEQEVFQNLFDNYYEAIRNFLYYKSGEIELAEDLTQEAFLILWKKRENINPEKAKSYLYTIANNLFLNEIKHQKVVLRFQQQPVSNVFFESPQFMMEEEEFKHKLEKAISDLPEKNRSVFLMNRVEKMTYKEIADRLELSVKAVEKRMHKALTELRKLSEKI
ncbi:MAG: RNA polymerase sigma-70 factor [Bacteroidia bacterium]